MPILEKVHDLWEHLFWADLTLLRAVLATGDSSPEAVREYAHVIGAERVLHVPLHGQYHRGKINLLLRQAGRQPAPTDYITFVRGLPAATEEAARHSSRSG